ncbi:hypothetical protein Tco_1112464 [Tanacetum coccineum]|uniref:Uncharacterized protein n=1 Tax=Tanacetum coccineum TaxID=301880 RepID=A0ABQ5IPG1_9ASTR
MSEGRGKGGWGRGSYLGFMRMQFGGLNYELGRGSHGADGYECYDEVERGVDGARGLYGLLWSPRLADRSSGGGIKEGIVCGFGKVGERGGQVGEGREKEKIGVGVDEVGEEWQGGGEGTVFAFWRAFLRAAIGVGSEGLVGIMKGGRREGDSDSRIAVGDFRRGVDDSYVGMGESEGVIRGVKDWGVCVGADRGRVRVGVFGRLGVGDGCGGRGPPWNCLVAGAGGSRQARVVGGKWGAVDRGGIARDKRDRGMGSLAWSQEREEGCRGMLNRCRVKRNCWIGERKVGVCAMVEGVRGVFFGGGKCG